MAEETHQDQAAVEVLTLLRKKTGELNKEIEEALRRVRARGTGDVTNEAETASQAEPEEKAPPSMRELVEVHLRQHSAGVQEIARALSEPVGRIAEVVRALRAESRVYNVGNEDSPLWTFRVGDEASTAELKALVRRLISERPMTTRELTDATGARMPRVNGVLVELQRSEPRIMNLGKGHIYRWFILPEGASIATLRPKTTTKRS